MEINIIICHVPHDINLTSGFILIIICTPHEIGCYKQDCFLPQYAGESEKEITVHHPDDKCFYISQIAMQDTP